MLNWEDIQIFVAVARAGGLAGAVATTKLSPPTLGRRIQNLEQELGITLFDRHRTGYNLTSAGKELFDRSATFEQGAIAIERWREFADPQPIVKIAAGAWTSTYIARNIQKLLPEKELLRIELVSGSQFLDLSRRAANLGIRNKRPHQTGLACRKIGQVEFAIYGSKTYVQSHPACETSDRYENCDWVTLLSATGNLPSMVWLEQYMPNPARISCSSTQAVLAAVISGAGLCILPCFIGNTEPDLEIVSEKIKDLTSTRWLVSHDDDRHNKPLRLVANRLATILKQA